MKTRIEREYGFVVVKKADGEVTFTPISTLTIAGTVGGEIRNVHKIIFKFCLTKDNIACVR